MESLFRILRQRSKERSHETFASEILSAMRYNHRKDMVSHSPDTQRATLFTHGLDPPRYHGRSMLARHAKDMFLEYSQAKLRKLRVDMQMWVGFQLLKFS